MRRVVSPGVGRGWRYPGALLACVLGLASVAAAQDPSLERRLEEGQPLVTAIHAFQRECGLWPQTLDDLRPDFRNARPNRKWDYKWHPTDECYLRVTVADADEHTRRPVWLVYVFEERGGTWFVKRNGAYVPLHDVPPPQFSPPLPEEERIQRALAEFDRRIQQTPAEPLPYSCKVSYLYDHDRLDEALAAAMVWARAMPRTWAPREALRAVLKKRQTGLDHNDWDDALAKQAHPSYAQWYVFNRPGSGSDAQDRWPDALRLPFATNEAEWFIAEMGAYEAAEFCQRGEFWQRTIETCDLWEAAVRQQGRSNDASYLPIRAAAYLALGDLESARRDMKIAQQPENRNRVWSGSIDALRRAVEAGDSTFRYEVETSPAHGRSWYLSGVH